jgi:phosphatidylserine/phosphatidylglycerophosphate/cardiolipin synthase-like enzyme
VHAKTCMVDDTWATIGSDNFNRRSWTHDSELSAVVLDEDGAYARRLRLTLAAEHLDREVDPASGPEGLEEAMADCREPAGMFAAFMASAERLDAWHAAGRTGERPPGRLRRITPPDLGPVARGLAMVPYRVVHDPDGRPRPLRRDGGF